MNKGTCRECGREGRRIVHRERGICSACWQRWRKTSAWEPTPWNRRRQPMCPTSFVLRHIISAPSGCWLWTSGLNNCGYGVTGGNAGRSRMAHRFSYETFVGPIPAGLVIDHLCRVRSCVNPRHLEPVTHRENTMRSPVAVAALNAAKTHCPQGHPYDETNTYRQKSGYRMCRTCNNARRLARYYAQKAVPA